MILPGAHENSAAGSSPGIPQVFFGISQGISFKMTLAILPGIPRGIPSVVSLKMDQGDSSVILLGVS